MKKKRHFLLFLFGILCTCVYGQGSNEASIEDYPAQPNAQVWSFMQYGDEAFQMNTGTVSYDIPLYTYKDPDFEIPISLSYASNGYRPNRQASSCGLGWFLNAGGYVSRVVKGIRDDYYYGGAMLGFYYQVFQDADITYDNIFEHGGVKMFASEYDDFCLLESSHSSGFESEPDEFTFKFLNHSGNFIQNFSGYDVYNSNHPSGEYLISMTLYPFLNQRGGIIDITTGDGYVYSFGRKEDMGKYSMFDSYELPRVYWALMQITAPNGRIAKFEYGTEEFNANSQWYREYRDIKRNSEIPYFGTIRESVYQLSKIIIDDVTIEFGYKPRTPENKYEERLIPLSSTSLLETITVKKRQVTEPLKQIRCNYSYASATDNPVLFLREVNISGEGSYRMDYYDLDRSFPAHESIDLDHWGYYNRASGKNQYVGPRLGEDLKPDVRLNENNEEEIEPGLRDPNWQGARIGMLEKITYPTGGYTKYYYEPNRYAARLTRSYLNDCHPYLEMTEKLSEETGGMRVKRIVDYTSDTDSTYRDYLYRGCSEKGLVGTETGILLHMPRYKPELDSIDDHDWHSAKSYINTIPYTLDPYHVEYPDVIERYQDGSFVAYHFSSYRDYPDEPFVYEDIIPSYSLLPTLPDRNNKMVIVNHSRHLMRGKLLTKTIFNADRIPQKKEYDLYDFSRPFKFHPIVKTVNHYFYKYKMYVESPELREKRIVDYYANGQDSLLSSTICWYNAKKQLTSLVKTISGGTTRSTYFNYVTDIPVRDLKDIDLMMLDKNVVNVPLEVLEVLHDNAGGIKLSRSEKHVFTSISLSDTTAQVVPLKRIAAEISDTTNVSDRLRYYPVIHYDAYDKMGRILQATDLNGLTVCYVWGYGGLYPIAKITGTDLRTICRLAEFSGIVEAPFADGLPASAESSLRSIDGALVTSYTYQPLVGVTEIKDPAGRKRTFFYNANGKLVRECDDRGNTLKSYTYSSDLQ